MKEEIVEEEEVEGGEEEEEEEVKEEMKEKPKEEFDDVKEEKAVEHQMIGLTQVKEEECAVAVFADDIVTASNVSHSQDDNTDYKQMESVASDDIAAKPKSEETSDVDGDLDGEVTQEGESGLNFTLLSEDELCLSDEDDPTEEASKTIDSENTCNLCYKTFKGPIGLKKHNGHMHKDGTLTKTKKLKRVNGKELIERKLEEGESNGSHFSCNLCGEVFQGSIVLSSHIARVHPDPELNEQAKRESYSEYDNDVSVGDHKERQPTDEKLFCKLCDHISSTKPSLKYHMKKQHSATNDENFDHCELCQQRFKGSLGLKLHQRRAHSIVKGEKNIGTKSEPVESEQVEFASSLADSEELVAQNDYEDTTDVKNEFPSSSEEVHSEELLDFTFLSEDELSLATEDMPMNNSSTPLAASNVCAICDKKFNGTSGLKRHIGMMHKDGDNLQKLPKSSNSKTSTKTETKPVEPSYEDRKPQLVCHFCNEEFGQIKQLNIHITREHPQTTASVADLKEAFVLCVLCSATFKTRVELKRHKQSEHRDQQFPCSQCKFIGDTPNSLQNHRNNVCRVEVGVF